MTELFHPERLVYHSKCWTF